MNGPVWLADAIARLRHAGPVYVTPASCRAALGQGTKSPLLTGVLQVLAGVFRLGGLMRFVSRSVVTGFVNALAILIFLAQLPGAAPRDHR